MLTHRLAVALCIIVGSVNGFQNQKLNSNHPPVSECVVRVINKVFPKNVSFAYIFNDHPEYLPFDLNKPHVIVNSSKSIRGYYAEYENDYVIEANDIDQIRSTFYNLLKGPIWVRGKFTRGRFLVVTAEKDLGAVFQLLWSFFLVNVVVIQYENEIDAQNMTISTANRFHEQNNCSQTPKAFHSQQCDLQLSVKFEKYIRNYGGCTIHVSVYLHGHASTLWGKTVFFFLQEIKETLNAKVISNYIDMNTFLNVDPQKTMIITVFRKGVLTRKLDDSDAFYTPIYVWIGEKPLRRSPYITYIVPFKGILWFIIVLVAVAVILVWRFILFVTKFSRSTLSISSDAISLLLGVSIDRISPNVCVRILIAFYLVYVIHIQTVYTSNLINIIVLPQYENSISSVYDLENSNMKIYVQESVYNEYIRFEKERFKRMKFNVIPNEGLTRYLKSLNDTNYFVVIRRSQWHPPKLNPDIANQYLKGKAPNFFLDKSLGVHQSHCFVMTKGHYLLPSLNRIISYFHEGGMQSYVEKNTDYSYIIEEDVHAYQSKAEFFGSPADFVFYGDAEHDFKTALTLAHLSGAFIVLIVGLGLAIMVFLIELLAYKIKMP